MAACKFEEHQRISRELAALLAHAVQESGQTRLAIAARAAINKDALRRILSGARPATFHEALAILAASGDAPHSAIILALLGRSDRATEWNRTGLLEFLEGFIAELPDALEEVLGERLQEVRPRWAKGAAHRTARLLSDHVEQLERQDAQSFAV